MVVKTSITNTAQNILEKEDEWRVRTVSIENAIRVVSDIYFDLICFEIDTVNKQILDLIRIVKNKRLKTKIMAVIPCETNLKHILLSYGCDDYLCKPYHSIDLLLRCKKLTNCIPTQYEIVYECNYLRYEQRLNRVMYNSTYIPLTPTEINIIKILIKRQFATKEDIVKYIESRDGRVLSTNYITVIMYRIRQKLKLCTGREVIENKYGQGYRIIC